MAEDELIKKALKRLGLGRNPNLEDIKKAYRKRAKETHPDSPDGDQEEFLRVKRAYDYLVQNYQEPVEGEPPEREIVPYEGKVEKKKDASLVAYEGGGGKKPPKGTKLLPAPEEGKNLPAKREYQLPAEYSEKKKPRVILGTRTRIHLSRPHTRRGEIVWALVMIIAGMTGAALLGSMWIFFSFLCLGLYILVPGPDEVIGGELRKIKDKYIKRIEGASSDAEREAIEKDLEETLKNQRTIERIKAGQGLIKWGASSVKYLFRAGFFVLFSLGFITSAIPLMKPLGILIAFIGYFMEG